MSLHDIALNTLAGEPATLGEHKGKALLLVNVASKSGLTPQYTGRAQMHEKNNNQCVMVHGYPCNQ